MNESETKKKQVYENQTLWNFSKIPMKQVIPWEYRSSVI